ncbi:MAG: hypothetical protein WDZ94_00095 [Patescibacteria group bacterium]
MSSELLVNEATKRGCRVEIINRDKNVYVIYNPADNQPHLFKASAIMKNNVVGSRITDFKDITFQVLQHFFPDAPLPSSTICRSGDNVEKLIIEKKLRYPLVVKATDGSHGENVFVNITNAQDLQTALSSAYAYNNNNEAIVQEMLQGDDHRLLVVGYKLVAASKRLPAFVTGNGKNTIRELVDIENNHPDRGLDYTKPLTKIVLDEDVEKLLSIKKLTLDSIPDLGVRVLLKNTANISSGGVAIDCTDDVHVDTRRAVEQIAQRLRLGLVAFDIISPDISKKTSDVRAGIIELNDTPGLRMHHFPYSGKTRNVSQDILDFCFEG